ncbi:MAG TPA: hypothetical protein VJ302_22865, partial [Blastocatellia bacterium]|nr:hypothetical protein [Blastocatellia bacterium]
DDRVRFCSQCNLNVYNLSGLTRPEAEDLINRAEGGLCVRFYRRSDGTILTRNCPVGLRTIRRRVAWGAQLLLGMLLSALGLWSLPFIKKISQLSSPRALWGSIPPLTEPSEAVPVMGKYAAPEKAEARKDFDHPSGPR